MSVSRSLRQRLWLSLVLVGLASPVAGVQHVCSSGSNEASVCNADAECPGSVCVVAPGVCDGGDDNGKACDTTCAGEQPCVGAYKLCQSGPNASIACLRDDHCPGSRCIASGLRCSGGQFDGTTCLGASDCPGGACRGPLPTSTPTATATRSITPTVAATFTRTSGPTLRPTPTPQVVVISIGSTVGGPGDILPVRVSIETSGVGVVATANDITFDSTFVALDPAACRINPAIGKTLHASVVQVDGTHMTIRLQVQAGQHLAPIPDGLLYTCTARVAASTLPNTYRLKSDLAIAYDAAGMPVPLVMGLSGTITVSLIGGACAGDCSHDGDVTVDELIVGVNIALGVDSAEDCASLDSNSDGAVTIDELIVAVNNALAGCVSIPTPVPTATATAAPEPITLYVRVSGSDAHPGTAPDAALATITQAAFLAKTGYRIIVGPGTYNEAVVTSTNGAPQNLRFVADVTGASTGDAPGAVLIDATGTASGAGFKFSNSSGSVIDGFTVRGASDAAVIVRGGSNGVTVRNCIVMDNPGAGIRVQDSSDALVFNTSSTTTAARE